MTRAYVYTILPSLLTSFKISSMGDTIGTMTQDRPTAVAGTLGKGPALVPMTVALERSAEAAPAGGAAEIPKQTFKYSLVNDQMFTPLIAYVAMFNTLASYERQFGASTISVRSRARIKGHDALSVEDVFTGDSPILGAATAVAGPLTMLLSNDIEPITLEGLDITITSGNAAPRDHRAVWPTTSAAQRRRSRSHAQLSRRRENLDGADRDSSNASGRSIRSATAVAERTRAARRAAHAEPQTVTQLVRC